MSLSTYLRDSSDTPIYSSLVAERAALPAVESLAAGIWLEHWAHDRGDTPVQQVQAQEEA